MKLRLYHHHDGTRVAYREHGTGPPLAILHSLMLSHREWQPLVEHLEDRFRLVLPDLPLHGDSESSPRHPYTPDWFVDVMAGFVADVLGPRPLLAGHDLGAEILLHATAAGRIDPRRIVLMPSRMHRAAPHRATRRLWRAITSAARIPGVDRIESHAASYVFRPSLARRLCVTDSEAAADLLRQSFADVGGNAELARAWARFAWRWPLAADDDLRAAYERLDLPVLLLWADSDEAHPVATAEEALSLLPNAQLRVLGGTGHLLAFDDAVGAAREIAAFCG